MDLEDAVMLRDENDVPSISDLIRDCQYESNTFHLSQLMANCEWLCATSTFAPTCSGDEIKRIKEEGDDEDSTDSPVSIQEQLPVSLFKEAKRRQRPWSKSFNQTSNYSLRRVANCKHKIYICEYTYVYTYTIHAGICVLQRKKYRA